MVNVAVLSPQLEKGKAHEQIQETIAYDLVLQIPHGADCGLHEATEVQGRDSVFRDLRRRPYWGNHFWVEGYCVATVGLYKKKMRKHVKYQGRQERGQEEFRFGQ